MFKYLAATILALSVSATAMAANLPGTQPIKVPHMKVLAIDDLGNKFSAGLFKDIQKYPEHLAMMPNGEAEAVFRTYLIRTKGHIILMDTGWGQTTAKKGQTLEVLAKMGIKPEAVTDVVMTHLDMDHVMGLMHHGKATYPNAIVHMSAAEYDGWLLTGNARAEKTVNAVKAIMKMYEGRIKPFDFDKEILPDIVARDASGHTVGHTLYELGGLKGVAIVGDLLHVEPLQFRFTDYNSRFDMNPEKAASMREKWLKHYSETNQTVAGMHFKSIGKVRQHPEGGYQIVK